MSRSHLLLTVVLIIAGLFVYDAVRGDPPSGSRDWDASRDDPMPYARPSGTPATLSSALDPGARAALERQGARLEALEKALAAHLDAGEGNAREPADEAMSETAPHLRPGEEDLVRFEALLAAVERRRQERRTAEGIGRGLDALDLEVTPDQRKAVIDRVMDYRSGTAHAQRTTDPADLSPKLILLAREYEEAIFRIVRASDARTILEAMPAYRPTAGGGAVADGRLVNGAPATVGR